MEDKRSHSRADEASKPAKADTRNILTSSSSTSYIASMPGIPHVYEALEDHARRDNERLLAINGEIKKLRGAYLKYRDLVEERSSLEDRLRVNLSITKYARNLFSKDIRMDQGLDTIDTNRERMTIPLWKVIREIIRHTEEIQIVDLEAQLVSFSYTITRQAIDSAIKTHPSVFRERKRGREIFVSLK